MGVGREGPANKGRPPGGAGGRKGDLGMSTGDYLSIISLVITMVMGLPGTILAIIQIRDALKPGKGRHHWRLRKHRHR